MVEFRAGMDAHSLDILVGEEAQKYREARRSRPCEAWAGKAVGMLQWHKERPPRLVLNESLASISLDDVREVLEYYEALKKIGSDT